MAIIKIRDADGTVKELLAIKGEDGKDGKDYVLTEADKQEIAGIVSAPNDSVLAFGDVDIDGVYWHYRKWISGFAECWGTFAKTGDVYENSELGNAAGTGFSTPFAFVTEYTGNPTVFITLEEAIFDNTTDPYNPIFVGSRCLEYAMCLGESVDIVIRTFEDDRPTISGSVYITGWWKSQEGEAE